MIAIYSEGVVNVLFRGIFVTYQAIVKAARGFTMIVGAMLYCQFPRVITLTQGTGIFYDIPAGSIGTCQLRFLGVIAGFLLGG